MHSQGCILRRGGESWPNKTQVTPRRISLTRDERRRSQAPLVDQNSLRNADSPGPGVPPGPPCAEQGLHASPSAGAFSSESYFLLAAVGLGASRSSAPLP